MMVDPIIFSIFGFELRYYSVLLVLGFVFGYLFLLKFGRREFGKKIIEDYSFYLALGIILFARLFEVLFYSPSYYFSDPIKIFYLWEGGVASHGAIIGALLVTYWFSKKNKINFYSLSDLVVIPIALAAALVRVGNFINQELIGKVTSVSWGIEFNGAEGLRHPVQLYQSFANFITFGILYFLKDLRKVKPGVLTWLFFLIYSLFRFFTEFFKDLPLDYGFVYLSLNLAQWFSLVLVVISVVMLIRLRK